MNTGEPVFDQRQGGGKRLGGASVALGLVVMVIGAAFLADHLGLGGFRINVPVWPWVMVLLAVGRFSDGPVNARGERRVSRTGIWFLIIGVWGFLNEYRLFGLHYGHSWPLLLVGAGAMIVWRALDPDDAAECGSRRKTLES
jgi:hypothetical protein